MGLRDTLSSMRQGEADAKVTAESTVADWEKAHADLLNTIRFDWLSEYVKDGSLSIQDSVQLTHQGDLGRYNAVKLTIKANSQTIHIEPKRVGIMEIHNQRFGWDGRISYTRGQANPWAIAMPSEDEHDAMIAGTDPTWHFKPLAKDTFESVLEEIIKGPPQHRGAAK